MEELKLDPARTLEAAPGSTALDYGLAVASVAGLLFPFVGAGITLVDLVTAPLRDKRFKEWCEAIRLRLNEVSQKVEGMTPETLAKDEAFFSAFAQATQAALRTHQKEKLDALRNAALNVALGRETDVDRQQQFLSLVDRFTVAHLVVLRFLNDPGGHFQKHGESSPQLTHVAQKLLVNDLVAKGLPLLRKSPTGRGTSTSFQFIEMILGELVGLRLLTLERHQETWAVPAFAIKPSGGPIGKMTTHLGEDFLAFIAEPDLEKENGS
jgi:hypothetical protein